jgi:predicted transposase YdaD
MLQLAPFSETRVYKEIIAIGKTEGEAKGKADAIIACLIKMHKTILPEKLQMKILAEKNLNVLENWFETALTAENFQDFRTKTDL